MNLPVVGLVEEVVIKGGKTVKSLALFDTGANTTSIDITLASEAQLGPVIKMSRIKTASKKERVSRPVLKATITVQGKDFACNVNLQDRSHMTFPVIIGRNIIAGNFLVDAQKNAHFLRKGKEAHIS